MFYFLYSWKMFNLMMCWIQESFKHIQTSIQPVSDPSQDNWTLGFKVTLVTEVVILFYQVSKLIAFSDNQSQASPHETMLDVLKVFHNLNVRWKKIGHYNMKCLWLPPLSRYPVSSAAVPIRDGDAIKFETQVNYHILPPFLILVWFYSFTQANFSLIRISKKTIIPLRITTGL